jgi:hypothetical protein
MRFAVRYALFFVPVLMLALGATLGAHQLADHFARPNVLWTVAANCVPPFLTGLFAYYVIARRVMSAYDKATLGHHVVRAFPLYAMAGLTVLALLLELSSPDAGITFQLLLAPGFAALGGILGDVTAGSMADTPR